MSRLLKVGLLLLVMGLLFSANLFFGTKLPTIHVSAQNPVLITELAWSPDGTLLAVGSNDGVRVYRIDGDHATLLWQASTLYYISVLQFSPLGTWLAAGLGQTAAYGADPTVHIWTANTGDPVASLMANNFSIASLAFTPDEQHLVTAGGYATLVAGGDYRVRTWETTHWGDLPELENRGRGYVRAIAFDRDGRTLAFGSGSRAVQILESATNAVLAYIHQEGTQWIGFSDDSSHIVLSFQHSVQVWEVRLQPEYHLVRQSLWESINYSTPGNFVPREGVIGTSLERFATESGDSILRVRSGDSGEIESTYTEDGKLFKTAAFSPDGIHLAFVSDARSIQIMPTPTPVVPTQMPSPLLEPILPYGLPPLPTPSPQFSYEPDYRVAIWRIGSEQAVYINFDQSMPPTE